MLASLGKPVTYMKRTAIGGLILDPDLPAGHYREMTDAERELITRKNAELREMREFLHKMHK
jgi:16S rRNA pseudouridine516 synthase